MAAFFSNFRNVFVTGLILGIIVVIGFGIHGPQTDGHIDTAIFAQAVLRWLHVFFGILWIGLLYYFNFVQIRVMPNIPAEQKPAVSKHIAPEALFWFRYAALFTVLVGLGLAWVRGYLVQALALGLVGENHNFAFIGIGMWLGIIMFINVWAFIWPAQKIALGIKEADADAKAAAAKKAMMFSRLNTLLSLPMLASMTMYQTIFN